MLGARFILWKALRDWLAVCEKGYYPLANPKCYSTSVQLGFNDDAEELEAFFKSDWCEQLAEVVGGAGGYLAYLGQVKVIQDTGWPDGLSRMTVVRWARDWDCCRKCGTTGRLHAAHGLCKLCYQRQYRGCS